jgi:hypothetical protein
MRRQKVAACLNDEILQWRHNPPSKAIPSMMVSLLQSLQTKTVALQTSSLYAVGQAVQRRRDEGQGALERYIRKHKAHATCVFVLVCLANTCYTSNMSANSLDPLCFASVYLWCRKARSELCEGAKGQMLLCKDDEDEDLPPRYPTKERWTLG